MKKLVDSVDATPAKRLYLSIIADYDTNRAICELVDNAIDIWMKSGRSRRIAIEVEIDWQQQTIKVCDDAGGIDRSELSHIVGPGHTGTAETQESIGIFGVGTKRAVVALAQAISIRTRRGKETYALEFDDNWIETEESWHINVYQVDNIPEGRTQIELVKLRKPVSAETVSRLREHLGATYAKFLLSETLDIILNGRPVDPIVFDDWAYPPHFDPRRYVGIIPGSGGTQVRVEAVAGLVKESSPAGGEYGVYFYCNDRLIARALKTFEVGFGPGLAGKPHAEISLARVLVCLNGEARLMPWNSSKSDINSSHETFVALRPWLLQVVRDYTSLARRMSKLEGGWQENVFRYTKGDIQQVEVDDFPHVNTSYLPPLPQVRPRYSTIVLGKNQEVLKKKPWARGLPESIITVDWLLKQQFEQGNRIALVMLDSTLEIAFKEFLVNESGMSYSDGRLQGMFRERAQVHKEMRRHVRIAESDWKKIEYYYLQRCHLIHRRAAVTIPDGDIRDFRLVVERVLRKLFRLHF